MRMATLPLRICRVTVAEGSIGEMADQWPDWYLNCENEDAIRRSLDELARYSNPAQTVRYGLGLGLTGLLAGQDDKRDQARTVAEALVRQPVRYTREPFNPRRTGGQIVRTTRELLDGSGTCLDFAVTLAALLTQQDIPAVLAIALPGETTDGEGHAFVFAYDDGNDDEKADEIGRSVPLTKSYQEWASDLDGPNCPFELLDVTPPYGKADASLEDRNTTTREMLAHSGTLYTVDVRTALNDADLDYHSPPARARPLGITAYLPDPVADVLPFPSREQVQEKLHAATGRIVLVGESGTGKSTLALERAARVSEHRGWFLDGSDAATLTRSLAAAEAQSRGEATGPEDTDNLQTRTYQARRRLSRSERPWVVVVDNADELEEVLPLLPAPRPSVGSRAADVLIVTSTDEQRASDLDPGVWRVERVGLLDDATDAALPAVQGVWPLLHPSERLPGLVRIARRCAPELLAARTEEPGAGRIVRTVLGLPVRSDGAGAPEETALLRAVSAASVMPAEQISVRWVAEAAFGGNLERAVAALAEAELAGLVERSRADEEGYPGHHPPLWMHRLVRAAVRDVAVRAVGLRTLAAHGSARYSGEEIGELYEFVRHRPDDRSTSADDVLAATTVVDLLETRGGTGLRRAAELAESYLDEVDELLGLQTLPGITAYAKAQMARARTVSHDNNATEPQIDDGLARCVAATDACTRLIDALGEDADDRKDVALLRGRSEAMRGILLRKKASLLPTGSDDDRKARLYRECIEILEGSYRERRSVFEADDGSLTRDPDRHVDRGWYNLGGPNIGLANLRHAVDPGESGRAAVADAVTAAMVAYAGSLSLRRDGPTSYTAASLWGVALCAYTAALHCPGLLELTDVEPTEELNGIANVQTRETLLRAAEHCAMRALMIWTELDGQHENARRLLRKISLAWVTTADDPARWRTQLATAIRPALKDLEIPDLHVAQ